MKKYILIFSLFCFTSAFAQLGREGLSPAVTITSTGASTLPYQPIAGEEALYYLNGNSADSSKNHLDGTANNINYTTDAAFTGFVASFGGTNSYISNTSFTAMASQDTYMAFAWFKSLNTNRQTLLYVNNGVNNFINLSTSVSATNGYATAYIVSGVAGDMVTGSTNICDGAKHLIVGVRARNNLYLYVDGALIASSSTATTTAYSTTELYLGASSNIPDFPFNGLLGASGLVGGAWNAETILDYYNANK